MGKVVSWSTGGAKEESAKSEIRQHQERQIEAMNASIADCHKDLALFEDLQKIQTFERREFAQWQNRLLER